jgi:hypothetical protein
MMTQGGARQGRSLRGKVTGMMTQGGVRHGTAGHGTAGQGKVHRTLLSFSLDKRKEKHYCLNVIGEHEAQRRKEAMTNTVDRDAIRVWNQTSREVWACVKAFHAQMQVQFPGLMLRETVSALLQEGLKRSSHVHSTIREQKATGE